MQIIGLSKFFRLDNRIITPWSQLIILFHGFKTWKFYPQKPRQCTACLELHLPHAVILL